VLEESQVFGQSDLFIEWQGRFCKGSAAEVMSQAYIALDQRYITADEFNHIEGLAKEVSKLIAGLIEYLKGSSIKGRKFLTKNSKLETWNSKR
jgi:hypothetical protein